MNSFLTMTLLVNYRVEQTPPEVFQQAFHHRPVAVWQPEELADNVPIVLRQSIVVQLPLWWTPALSPALLQQCSHCSRLQFFLLLQNFWLDEDFT